MTIDVEDDFNVSLRDWLGLDTPPTEAVVRNTHRIAELLSEADVRATFFVLGEVGRTFPGLVRGLVGAGHEIGVHGTSHRKVTEMTPEEFRTEAGGARKLLQDISGQPVDGHRAPVFSIGPGNAWALEVLAELGFEYDSSIFPIAGRRYGWPGFPLDIHRMDLPDGRSIVEAPLSVFRLLGKSVPACGGGYLRIFPYWFTVLAMRQITRSRPAIVYLHPYEIDAACSEDFHRRIAASPGGAKEHALSKRGRATVESKLRRLLRTYPFGPMRELIRGKMG